MNTSKGKRMVSESLIGKTKRLVKEPVLLWQNENPSGEFDEDITVPDMSGFKYIVIEMSDYGSHGKFAKIPYALNSGFEHVITEDSAYLRRRNLHIASSTKISVSDCTTIVFEDGAYEVSNGYCIPMAVYGTNIL